jgi:hypothetical protein
MDQGHWGKRLLARCGRWPTAVLAVWPCMHPARAQSLPQCPQNQRPADARPPTAGLAAAASSIAAVARISVPVAVSPALPATPGVCLTTSGLFLHPSMETGQWWGRLAYAAGIHHLQQGVRPLDTALPAPTAADFAGCMLGRLSLSGDALANAVQNVVDWPEVWSAATEEARVVARWRMLRGAEACR